MSRQPKGPWVSKQWTADHLDVTTRTVDQMIADGRLTGYRIGRTVRLRRDEVEAALVPYGGGVK